MRLAAPSNHERCTRHEVRKTGKKKVKAVVRALKGVNTTPKTPGRQLPANLLNNTFTSPAGPPPHPSTRPTPQVSTNIGSIAAGDATAEQIEGEQFESTQKKGNASEETSPITIPGTASRLGTGDPLVQDERWDSGEVTTYGSFIPSPSSRTGPIGPPSLELPGPALPPEEDAFAKHNRAWRKGHFPQNPHTTPLSQQLAANTGDAYHVGKTQSTGKLESSQLLPKHKRFLRPHRSVSTPHHGSSGLRPRLLRRMFSASNPNTPNGDVPLEAYKIYDEKMADFYSFLDSELLKVDEFYKMKEAHSNKRLQSLRDQLHEMRDRRIQEIRHEQEVKRQAREHQDRVDRGLSEAGQDPSKANQSAMSTVARYFQPIERALGLGPARIGKTSRALQKLGSPSEPHPSYPPGSNRPESWRDFSRRPERDDIPHRAAKRKLKLALQEFYRGLELLKSFALLNRTAFRKINKKYDKAVKARPTQRYMTEKVNKSWFVQSEVLDHQLVAVEDLYARYFERGNHKVAVGKLRSKTSKNADYTGSVFRNGMLLAGAAVFGIQGIVYAGEHLNDPNSKIRIDTGYLLQLPCLLLFILGLCIWLNFFMSGANAMFLYWPVILIGLSAIILFLPAPILYHRSREWWAYSNFRLLLAGLYPVEFRDFFLGDMYCSQTYSMGVAVWDLAMDWSLCNPYAEYPFLRDVLGYKRPQVYYLAMIIDPILRFNWIFYAIFANNFQHSAVLSFLVALSEVCRRGIWSLFRVENEHCTNVGRFRASRDVPLPYELPSPRSSISPTEGANRTPEQEPTPIQRRHTYADIDGAGSTALEAQPSPGTGTPRLRRRATLAESDTPIIRGIARIGTAMNQAHAQDFEKKRTNVMTTPGGVEGLERSPHYGGQTVGGDESSDEEEDEDEFARREAEEIVEEESGRVENGEDDSGAIEHPRRSERREEREERQREEEANERDMLGVQDVLERRRSAVD
ncbi:uncharacterized protein KY384_005115 [Bacidia gigantensis]|uniref:uncharacterized protein n=1 Tax=Bacidia gigantensis TaxID=2732470 RepID=UPI001D045A46|nr:uncharacterized protein KY384_005115 [Bacidia gigantensis]KAG8529635.1 hypothetical protein KY384_005115 [Bacidia gigantensis]